MKAKLNFLNYKPKPPTANEITDIKWVKLKNGDLVLVHDYGVVFFNKDTGLMAYSSRDWFNQEYCDQIEEMPQIEIELNIK